MKIDLKFEKKSIVKEDERKYNRATWDISRSRGFQRIQYLQQLDSLYELQNQLNNIKLEINRTKIESEKSIGQLINRLKQAEVKLQYQNVIAPVSGIVFNPKARVDGVISSETQYLQLSTKGLKAEVFVT